MQPKTLLLRWKYPLIALLLLAFFATLWLGPWWTPSTYRVTLYGWAVEDSHFVLEDAERDLSFPLVPLNINEHGWSREWAADLPPRKAYELTLRYPGDWDREKFLGMLMLERELWPDRSIRADIEEINAEAQTIRFAEIDCSNKEVSIMLWVFLNLLMLGLIATAAVMAPFRLRREPCAPLKCWNRRQSGGLIAVVVMSALLHVLLIVNATPEFWPADSTTYTWKAFGLVSEGRWTSDTYLFELNRLPGVPLAQALAFKLLGYKLNAITLVQALAFCGAMGWLVMTLRRHLRSVFLLPAVPLLFLSPALVWSSNLVASEPWFLIGCVGASAAFLRYWERRRWASWIAFTLLGLFTVFARPNGLILYTVPALLVLAAVCQPIAERRMGFLTSRDWWRAQCPLLATAGLMVVALGLWSWRNYESRGLFAPTDLGPVAKANIPFITGTLDGRAGASVGLYEQMTSDRRLIWGYHGWKVRQALFVDITDNWTHRDRTTLPMLNERLETFTEANDALLPLPARVNAHLRVFSWALFFADEENALGEGLRNDYTLDDSMPAGAQKSIAWISEDLEYEERSPGWLGQTFNDLSPAYTNFYVCLAVLGVFGYLVAAWRGQFLALALLTPFYANIVINTLVGNVNGRYVQILDWMALLGILLVVQDLCFRRSEPAAEPGAAK